MRFSFCIIERETKKDESNDTAFVCKIVCPQELSLKCTKQEKKYVNNDKIRQRILTNDPFGNKIRASTL
jgi:hypothetical protein